MELKIKEPYTSKWRIPKPNLSCDCCVMGECVYIKTVSMVISMKKKLYKVNRWNTKMWINHVENSEKQNVVILVVDLLSNHNYDTYCIP